MNGAASGVRVWLFDGGSFDVPAGLMEAGGGERRLRIPTVWAAVSHPQGLGMIDSGPTAPASSGSVCQPFSMEAALATMGAGPGKVRWLINTHLHVDHVGANRRLPNATVLVQESELTYARAPTDACMVAEYDSGLLRPGRSVDELLDGDLDLFGDGSVVILASPGHSPGHQSVLLRLHSGNHMLIAGDAVWTERCRSRDVLPGLLWSPEAYRASRERLLALADRHACRWVHAHEPGTFAEGGWPQAEAIG